MGSIAGLGEGVVVGWMNERIFLNDGVWLETGHVILFVSFVSFGITILFVCFDRTYSHGHS
jgi:hypothetical protein